MANTFGVAGSFSYVGRNQLDAATLGRFRPIWVDYDPKVERAVVGGSQAESVMTYVERVRRNLDKLKMKKVVCTRFARQLAEDLDMSFNSGKNLDDLFKSLCAAKGWSAEEATRAISGG
jgi:cobaltochelatase CobS